MTTQHDNGPVSIFTHYGIEVKEVPRDNSEYTGSLAALYDKTWKQRDPRAVFKLVDIPRDEKRSDQTSEPIPDKSCVLSWQVAGEVPCILRSPFQCRRIFVRNEYRCVLAELWKLFGKGFGHLAGFVPNEKIADIGAFPPTNPFVGLEIKSVEEQMVPGVVIAGTPGIGKSLFLLYLLALRLLAQQTTILQFAGHEFIVFEKAGVFVCSDLHSELRFLPEHTWFLVDSNKENIEPLQSFITSCLSYPRRLIVSASPRTERFDFKSKIPRLAVTWMKTFELWEIIAARKDQIFQTPEKECVYDAFYHKYGPIARLVYTCAGQPKIHRRSIVENLEQVPWDGLSQTIRNLASGSFDSPFSHNTIIAQPTAKDRSDFYVEFATKSVAELVMETFLNREQTRAQELYRYFLACPKARATAGHLLEATALVTFPRGGAWQMRKMEKLTKRKSSKNQIYAYRSTASVYTLVIGQRFALPVQILVGNTQIPQEDFHKVQQQTCNPGEEETSEEETSEEEMNEEEMNEEETSEEETNEEETSEEETSEEETSEEETSKAESKSATFCIPKASNNPGFDAWIYCPEQKLLVIFQATTLRQTHKIQTTALEWLCVPKGVKIVLVVVSDEAGGMQVSLRPEDSSWISDAYRLVM
ncbi:uncharacterized protein FOMMEDRAFT_143056 [Fomitiporia mediterranea MF3/22]|uniref:uncharacterized protein n=1 Tax=Fomitiporia mediterranea (strain MF3/22) TaxID=694068 RepID=UPI00044088E5|nr:uncharacterized protein FOMMEDRAFT_143056 [Fomitiporia mediterranea MF3/22]EJC98608.1 hypothetical protein FOMMEDRAFT_143056 [Fomitiporia mediterranea MF3/22]